MRTTQRTYCVHRYIAAGVYLCELLSSVEDPRAAEFLIEAWQAAQRGEGLPTEI